MILTEAEDRMVDGQQYATSLRERAFPVGLTVVYVRSIGNCMLETVMTCSSVLRICLERGELGKLNTSRRGLDCDPCCDGLWKLKHALSLRPPHSRPFKSVSVPVDCLYSFNLDEVLEKIVTLVILVFA